MGIAYGIKISGFDDPYIAYVEDAVRAVNAAGTTGAYLVDQIPALKYVPSWFPGAGFKKVGKYYTEVHRKVVELAFNHVSQQIVRTLIFDSTLSLHF